MLSTFLQRGNISRDFILTFISRVGVTVAGALIGILLARFLGASEYGSFSFAYSTILLALLFSKLGADSSATKFVAEYVSTEKYGLLFGFISSRRRLLYTLSLLGVIVCLGAIPALSLSRSQISILLAALPTFVLLSQLHFDQGVLYGFKQTAFSPLLEGFFRAVFLSIFVVGWWLLAFSPLNAALVLLFNGASLGLALIIGRLYLKQICKRYDEGLKTKRFENERWLATGFSHLLISCSHVVLAQTDLFMLGILESSKTVGYYAVAVQVSMLLLFVSNAVNPVITPRMAEAYSAGSTEKLGEYALLGTKIAFWGSLPVLLLLFFLRDELLELLFGAEYLAASGLLAILLLTQLTKIICAPIGFVMTMTEAEKLASYVIGFAAIVNIALNILLIPIYGAYGAAIATTCSAFLWNIILIVIVRRRFGFMLLPIAFGKNQ